MRADIERWIGRNSSDVLGIDVVPADELDGLVSLVERGSGCIDWEDIKLRLAIAGLSASQRREAIDIFQCALGINQPVMVRS